MVLGDVSDKATQMQRGIYKDDADDIIDDVAARRYQCPAPDPSSISVLTSTGHERA